MESFRPVAALAALLFVNATIRAQDRTDLRSKWDSVVHGRGVFQLERDSVPALNVKIRRVAAFRCFDCAVDHATLLLNEHDSALVTDTADLPGAWRVMRFPQPQASPDFRDQVMTLLKLTCIPGCHARILKSVDELDESFKAFLAPAESLRAVEKPADGSRAGALWTKFFVRSENGVAHIAAILKDGELFLNVRTVAVFQRS